ncbi:MAG: PIN domain-containing protein [Pseudomonadota bacterium]
MRVLLDANVLFPTVMREVLLGCARAGLLQPLWSPRILEEWRRAAGRKGADAAAAVGVEIALVTDAWPEAAVLPDPEVEAALWLPDANDVHVMAAALAGQAEVLMTLNARDFPTRILAKHGLLRRDPDGFLAELAVETAVVADAVAVAHRRAEQASGADQPLRPLLKRAGLPRLGRALVEGAKR